MLTADEIEALRRSATDFREMARRVFGWMPSQAEIKADRRGDEWREKRLREMREQERLLKDAVKNRRR